MFLLLNLSLCPVNYSLLSLFSSEMMLQNLLYLRSTKVRTKSWKDLRNFFFLQIGNKSNSVSVDRLIAVFSSVPVTPAVPPPRGRPHLPPASVIEPPAHVKKKVRFEFPRFLLRSSVGILTGRFEAFHLLPPSPSLSFWGEYLWLLRL